VAIEAINANRTTSEIAQAFGVHPNLVANLKKHAIELLPELFTPRKASPAKPASDPEKDDLYRQIGQMKVEVDLSKNELGARMRTKGDGSIPSIRN
jgi:hypothetical protein